MTFHASLPFLAGTAVATAVTRNWKDIQDIAAPVGQRIARNATTLFREGEARAWEIRERVEDQVATLQEARKTRST